MKLQPTTPDRFSNAFPLIVASFCTIALFASSIVRAQTEQPFIEIGLPGPAFSGVVPAPDGRLYGLTYEGGTSNKGTLYSVDTSLTAVVVHVNFDGTNGSIPYDELTYDAATAKFYGTTDRGGVNDLGTIFSYIPGANAVTTLKEDFGFASGAPRGPLVVSGGYIYGAIRVFPNDALFRMSIDGSGYTIIHNFVDSSSRPQALTLGPDGKLYGVTFAGGLNCNPSFPSETCGTVFRLRPVLPGDPDTQFQTLYQVQNLSDRALERKLVYGSDGLLYFNNFKRIFRLDPQNPNPASTFQMIWDESGASISMSIIEGADNRLYAANYGSGTVGAGRVFSLNRDGSGESNLRNFSFTAGSTAYGPYGLLYRSPSGIIYGTTEYTVTGTAYGTVFALGQGSNTPPVLSNVAAVSPITENGTTTLSGNFTDPDVGDTFALTVDWGDGSVPQVFNYAAGTTSFSETHRYLDDNPTATTSDNYNISLTLADNNGGSDTDSAIVTVNNAAPVLSNIIVNPSTIIAGGTTSVSGNISDVGTLDPHNVTISWGDGSPNTTLNLVAGVTFFNANHQYDSIGTFNIGITVSDDDTGSANGGASLTVNTPPVLSNVTVSSPITENGSATLSGNITDPNSGDQFSLTVNWGDGSPPQFFNYPPGTSAFNEAHQYRDDNPTATPADNYAISLSLSDGRESDADSATVTVNNAVPVLTNVAANPSTINVGGITNLSGTVSDVGTLDTHQIVITWGDGSPNTTLSLAAGITAFNSSHQYNASGTFNVGVTATDDDTGSANSGASVTVNPTVQQPPVLSNVAVTSPVSENGTATLTGNISDPNANDKFALTVDWGDGSAQVFKFAAGTNSFSVTHQYLDDNPTATPSDNHTIDLLLEDNAGGSDTDSTAVTVNNAAPVLSNILASPTTIVIGGTTNLSGNLSDVGTLDTQRIVIDWGDGSSETTLDLAAGITAFNANHQYNAAGVFNIEVKATDDDTASANGGASVAVNRPSGGKIAFASLRDGNYEIYSMNPDGSNQTRLTNNTAEDYAPAMSSDGNRIAFGSFRDGNYEIYVMNSDGTGQTRLTNNLRDDFQPSFSPDGSRIVFVSTRNGNYEIYVMDVDGKNQTRLTSHPAADYDPIFSPDGSKIAFSSSRNGFGQVYLMNADGSNQIRLTNVAADEYDPSFAPDGSRIAFSSFRNGSTAEIYVMNADGSNQTRLTDNAAGDISASFSSDGNQIAFVSNRDGRLEVYVMNADGTAQIRLTNNAQGNEYPSWGVLPSPAGGKLVFSSTRDGGNWEIYSMNSNGTNQTRLTNNPAVDLNSVISPDGSRIAFASDRDNNFNYEIYVMNADGTGQTRLTDSINNNLSPSFSPDGNRIVFVSDRVSGWDEIYVMNSDGTNQTRLTNNLSHDRAPTFSPDGNRIVFHSNRDGGASEIYVMNADGTNPTRLTNNSAADELPSFSPDGSRIVFASKRDDGLTAKIYAMNSDGTNQVRLSTVSASETYPAVSPDGSQIAFTSYRDDSEGELYKMNADGTNQVRLTRNAAQDAFSSWGIAPPAAPGRKIGFASTRDGNAEIYMMNSNGTNQVRLTNSATTDQEPSVSPDGSRVAFVSDRDGNFEIYVMNADGTSQTRLTNNSAIDTQPAFSPDGSRIVFVSTRDNNNGEIYVMNTDGTGQIRLTTNAVADFNPTFSPAGNRIAFASDRSGVRGIYLMNSNGSNQTRLTDGYEPSFSPDGNRIAFTSPDGFGPLGVFIINTNGTNRIRLTSNLSSNSEPAFSPDGSQIAFQSNRDGNFQIYLMNADGSNQMRLTNNASVDFSPSWGGLVLAAPTNLTATAVSPTQINLAWTDNSIGEDGFLIERCEGGTKCVFIQIAATNANVAAFASTGLRPATTYIYRVRAFGTGGNSPYSNPAKDKTPR
jgi:uncharacterized repeat protein (TIGR03803 family)